MPEKISYKTNDQVTIVGDWFTAPTMIGAMLLVPMMKESRASWVMLQRSLAKLGIASLAIDLRGHGDSTRGWQDAKLDYRAFDDDQHQECISDVSAGIDWIRKRGIGRDRIGVGGASFGANLALWMLKDTPSIRCGVVLSPGADYHGTNAVEYAKELVFSQSLFAAASEEDKSSFADTKEIFDDAVCQKKLFVPYKGAGHGTDMLKYDSTLSDKAADWVWNVFRG